jgi:hypothetical protein
MATAGLSKVLVLVCMHKTTCHYIPEESNSNIWGNQSCNQIENVVPLQEQRFNSKRRTELERCTLNVCLFVVRYWAGLVKWSDA